MNTQAKGNISAHPAGAVGILAGGGPLPGRVAQSIQQSGRPVFIVGFQDFADPAVIGGWPHQFVRLAAAGQILRALREHDCREVVLIGPVKRPSLRDIRPDAEGARILTRLGRALFSGDDGLLAALVRVFGEEGFIVRGAHHFLTDEVGGEGVMGQVSPDQQARSDCELGVRVVTTLGGLDIGQACVVQSGLVLAVEALEGTDAMLSRAGGLRQPGPGGVLIKMLKPGQEVRADMPTIGPDTVRNAYAAGLRGIVFQSGGTLLTDPHECVRVADDLGLFLEGIRIQAPSS